MKEGASYEKYVAAAYKDDVMSKERWTFVSKNFRADATANLHNFNSPVLLLLGDKDINVDWRETEQVYRKEVSPSSLLLVKVFADTEHSMLTTQTADSEFRALLISLFAPRKITVNGYMEQIAQFLKELP